MERIVGAWLNPRERVVAEFLIGPRPGWSRNFQRLLLFLAAAMAIALARPAWSGVVAFAAFGGLLLVGLSPNFGTWRGFGTGWSAGQSVPACALQPLSFGELIRLLMKVNFLHAVVVGALALLVGGWAGWQFGGSMLRGLDPTLRAVLLFLGTQPILALFPVSQITNDSSQFRLKALSVFGAQVAPLVGCAIGVFLVDALSLALLLVVVVAALSTLLLLTYRHAWSRGWFDLVRTDPPSS
jgi:hypothetical protein